MTSLLGPLAGVGEVARRVGDHPFRTVVVVLDGDAHRHVGCLSHDLSVSPGPPGTTADGHLVMPAWRR